jgi:hypothetical protein
MVTITLDECDRAVLERLRRGDADVEALADAVDSRPEYLRSRLPELADNGLVRRGEEGAWTLTENGQRAVAASPAGSMDDRIDAPPDVERRVESSDLRVDRADAVRATFAFLRHWGDATRAEIVDGVYSERPAAFESGAEWWSACVRDCLAALPRVESPASADQPWRCAGTSIVEQPTADGRVAPTDDPTVRTSVRFALEQLDLDEPERAAVRAAFARLLDRGSVSAAELGEEVFPDHDAGYGSPSEWWADCIRPAFRSFPGVESEADEAVWRYRQSSEGPMASAPGADAPEDPFGPEDGTDG